MLTLQILARIVELSSLLIAKGALIPILAQATVCHRIQGHTGPMYALMSYAGVAYLLVTVWARPPHLTVADWSVDSVGLTYAMKTEELFAWFTSWYNSRLHLSLGEVLELIVDIKVADAAVKTGSIKNFP